MLDLLSFEFYYVRLNVPNPEPILTEQLSVTQIFALV